MVETAVKTVIAFGFFGAAAVALFASAAIVWVNYAFSGRLPVRGEWFGPGTYAAIAVACGYAGYTIFPLRIYVAIGY